MQAKIKHVCCEILKKISPSEEERKAILKLAKDLEGKVSEIAKEKGVEAVVRVEGSVAKDTWLRKEPDIDVFLCLQPTIPRKTLGKVSLEIAREATSGWRQVERFAEHPYLEAFVHGYRVNIVPCYCAGRGKWLSATDRTPFHTDFVNKRLNESLRGEVRLLKRFMQGIGVYGAEIKVGGFSGYLCELFIIHFGPFAKVLEAFSKYSPKMVIDIENYYSGREKDLSLLFEEPLVVIDPVDKGRNVASAAKPEKIYTLVGAARAFLKSPSEEFFFPKPVVKFSKTELQQILCSRGSDCLFLTFKPGKSVPDIIWGQLYKTKRALRKALELEDFNVLRDAVWSDENSFSAFVFEVEQCQISGVKKHAGPPLEYSKECEDFLQKYNSNGCAVSGPYIEDGSWTVEVKRKHSNAVELLREKLEEGGKNTGVASLISKALNKEFHIMINNDILEVYLENEEFAVFLSDWLRGKPFWLNATQA